MAYDPLSGGTGYPPLTSSSLSPSSDALVALPLSLLFILSSSLSISSQSQWAPHLPLYLQFLSVPIVLAILCLFSLSWAAWKEGMREVRLIPNRKEGVMGLVLSAGLFGMIWGVRGVHPLIWIAVEIFALPLTLYLSLAAQDEDLNSKTLLAGSGGVILVGLTMLGKGASVLGCLLILAAALGRSWVRHEGKEMSLMEMVMINVIALLSSLPMYLILLPILRHSTAFHSGIDSIDILNITIYLVSTPLLLLLVQHISYPPFFTRNFLFFLSYWGVEVSLASTLNVTQWGGLGLTYLALAILEQMDIVKEVFKKIESRLTRKSSLGDEEIGGGVGPGEINLRLSEDVESLYGGSEYELSIPSSPSSSIFSPLVSPLRHRPLLLFVAYFPLLLFLLSPRSAIPNTLSSIDIAMSYYDEPLSQVLPFLNQLRLIPFISVRGGGKMIVYNKGPKTEEEIRKALKLRKREDIVRLDNWGREGGTYLRHIIRHYNATIEPTSETEPIADHTYFLQPHLAWGNLGSRRIELTSEKTGYLSFGPYVLSRCGEDMRGVGDYPRVGQIYETFRGERCVKDGSEQLTSWAAQFVASRQRIMANSFVHYKDLDDLLEAPDDHPIHKEWGPNDSGGRSNPTFGHSVERAWPIIMGCTDPEIARQCDDFTWLANKCQCFDRVE